MNETLSETTKRSEDFGRISSEEKAQKMATAEDPFREVKSDLERQEGGVSEHSENFDLAATRAGEKAGNQHEATKEAVLLAKGKVLDGLASAIGGTAERVTLSDNEIAKNREAREELWKQMIELLGIDESTAEEGVDEKVKYYATTKKTVDGKKIQLVKGEYGHGGTITEQYQFEILP